MGRSRRLGRARREGRREEGPFDPRRPARAVRTALRRFRRWLSTPAPNPDSGAIREEGFYPFEFPHHLRRPLMAAVERWEARWPQRWLPTRLRFHLLRQRMLRGRPLLPWRSPNALDRVVEEIEAERARWRRMKRGEGGAWSP